MSKHELIEARCKIASLVAGFSAKTEPSDEAVRDFTHDRRLFKFIMLLQEWKVRPAFTQGKSATRPEITSLSFRIGALGPE